DYSSPFDCAPLPSRTRLGAHHLAAVAAHRCEIETRTPRTISRHLRTHRATRPYRAMGELSHLRLRCAALGGWLQPGTNRHHSPIQRRPLHEWHDIHDAGPWRPTPH